MKNDIFFISSLQIILFFLAEQIRDFILNSIGIINRIFIMPHKKNIKILKGGK
jgi:hypothetical protein